MSFSSKFQPKTTGVSFAAQIIRDRALVYDLRTQQNGQTVYFIVKVDSSKHNAFQAAYSAGQTVNLEDFGEILYSGAGDPSDELKAELRERFGMYAA